jgi:hypothetical protein
MKEDLNNNNNENKKTSWSKQLENIKKIFKKRGIKPEPTTMAPTQEEVYHTPETTFYRPQWIDYGNNFFLHDAEWQDHEQLPPTREPEYKQGVLQTAPIPTRTPMPPTFEGPLFTTIVPKGYEREHHTQSTIPTTIPIRTDEIYYKQHPGTNRTPMPMPTTHAPTIDESAYIVPTKDVQPGTEKVRMSIDDDMVCKYGICPPELRILREALEEELEKEKAMINNDDNIKKGPHI